MTLLLYHSIADGEYNKKLMFQSCTLGDSRNMGAVRVAFTFRESYRFSELLVNLQRIHSNSYRESFVSTRIMYMRICVYMTRNNGGV